MFWTFKYLLYDSFSGGKNSFYKIFFGVVVVVVNDDDDDDDDDDDGDDDDVKVRWIKRFYEKKSNNNPRGEQLTRFAITWSLSQHMEQKQEFLNPSLSMIPR